MQTNRENEKEQAISTSTKEIGGKVRVDSVFSSLDFLAFNLIMHTYTLHKHLTERPEREINGHCNCDVFLCVGFLKVCRVTFSQNESCEMRRHRRGLHNGGNSSKY